MIIDDFVDLKIKNYHDVQLSRKKNSEVKTNVLD